MSSTQSQERRVQQNIHVVYLALGSNLGDRAQHLAESLRLLQQHMSIDRTSSVYETEPLGYTDQPDFFNIVCKGTTAHSVYALLHFAKEIESKLGRRLTFRNAPRPIDIDILLYDQDQIQQAELTIPHPRMNERAFVLIPLAEIAPDIIEPRSGRAITAVLQDPGIQAQRVQKVYSSFSF